jgi:putative transposase
VVHLIRAAPRARVPRRPQGLLRGPEGRLHRRQPRRRQLALLELADSPLGRKYPAAIAVWERAWDRFIPFLAFPPAVRKVIYTTSSIESLNHQYRKIIKNRGPFPHDQAVIKLLWSAIQDIEDKRARARAKDRGGPDGPRPDASCGNWS